MFFGWILESHNLAIFLWNLSVLLVLSFLHVQSFNLLPHLNQWNQGERGNGSLSLANESQFLLITMASISELLTSVKQHETTKLPMETEVSCASVYPRKDVSWETVVLHQVYLFNFKDVFKEVWEHVKSEVLKTKLPLSQLYIWCILVCICMNWVDRKKGWRSLELWTSSANLQEA